MLVRTGGGNRYPSSIGGSGIDTVRLFICTASHLTYQEPPGFLCAQQLSHSILCHYTAVGVPETASTLSPGLGNSYYPED